LGTIWGFIITVNLTGERPRTHSVCASVLLPEVIL